MNMNRARGTGISWFPILAGLVVATPGCTKSDSVGNIPEVAGAGADGGGCSDDCQPGPDLAPPAATNPVSWQIPTVQLQADDFWIVADGVRYGSADAVTSVHSYPLGVVFEFEVTWQEKGREMRLAIYFGADATQWWSPKISTYNGQVQTDWLNYEGVFFQSPLGTSYRGNIDLTNATTDPYRGELHIHGLVLSISMQGMLGQPDGGPVCTVQVYNGNVGDCSSRLPLPCAPCIACYPLPAGDTGGCGAPDLKFFNWNGGGVDTSLRYPTGCNVFLPTENPFYPGGAQQCTCDASAGWMCPV